MLLSSSKLNIRLKHSGDYFKRSSPQPPPPALPHPPNSLDLQPFPSTPSCKPFSFHGAHYLTHILSPSHVPASLLCNLFIPSMSPLFQQAINVSLHSVLISEHKPSADSLLLPETLCAEKSAIAEELVEPLSTASLTMYKGNTFWLMSLYFEKH